MGALPLLFSLILGTCIALIECQTGGDAKNLTTDLFLEYDKRVRPTEDQTSTTTDAFNWEESKIIYQGKDVTVAFILLSLNDLDEVSETMTTTGYLDVQWLDEYLRWEPNHYGGLFYYLWPQDMIWKPDISLRSSILEYKELGIPTLNVQVDYDGLITWKPFEIFKSSCTFDITYFPFDVQTCSLFFVAWSYTKAEVGMFGGQQGIDLSEYTASSMWDIVDTSWTVQEERGESGIIYTIKAKRKPLYYLLSIIMPIVLLASLNIFVFWLPCESGERAGFSVTIFLALAVFLTIVSEHLPSNSETVSIFSVYLIILTVQSTVITLFALITIRWHNHDPDEPIPAYLLALVRMSRCLCLRRRRKVSGEMATRANDQDADFSKTDASSENTIFRKKENVAEKRSPDPSSEGRDERNTSWRTIVLVLDGLLFICFAFVFLVVTVVCFITSSLAS